MLFLFVRCLYEFISVTVSYMYFIFFSLMLQLWAIIQSFIIVVIQLLLLNMFVRVNVLYRTHFFLFNYMRYILFYCVVINVICYHYISVCYLLVFIFRCLRYYMSYLSADDEICINYCLHVFIVYTVKLYVYGYQVLFCFYYIIIGIVNGISFVCMLLIIIF